MALIQDLVSPDKYDIKCPYAMNPVGHCIHNTANDASAKNEVSYMKSNNNEVSFHVAVDHLESRQGIPFNRNAWAAGDGGKGDGNRGYIHWEICYSKSGGNNFIESEKRCAREIAADLKARGWGIDRVKKHQDFSGKYCPHRTLDMGYSRIIEMIKAELGSLSGTPAPTPTPPKPTPQGTFFRVVSGSYSERVNAQNAQTALKTKGYDSFLEAIVAKDGKTYLRVIVGSFQDRANADERMNKLIADGFNAFVAAYNSTTTDSSTKPPQVSNPVPPTPSISVGSKVNIIGSKYATGQSIPSEQKGSKVHTVQQMTGDRTLLKEIYSWVYTKDIKLVTSSNTSQSSTIPSKGKCTVTTPSGIRFRNKPSVKSGVVQDTYRCGESVNYDSTVVAEGYTWVSWVSASTGARRYMPVISHNENEVWAKCI